MNTPNPYNYNLPVAPDMFFGRRQDLINLTANLTSTPGDSVALIGGRRMGKTSLLEAVVRNLPLSANKLPGHLLPLVLFLDLMHEQPTSAANLFHLVARRAHNALAKCLDLPPLDTDFLTTDQPTGPAFADLLTTWGRISLLQRGSPLRLILVLDECERIANQQWTSTLYSVLRSLLVGETTRSLLKVLMSGSHSFLSEVRESGSPLRNVLKYHMLSVFPEEVSQDLILRPTNKLLDEAVVTAVMQESGGHPFLIQYLMHHLWARGLTLANTTIVHRLARGFSHERSDFQDWTRGLGNPGLRIYQIFVQSSDTLSEYDLASALLPNPPADLSQTLDALCYHGLVVHLDDDTYRVTGQMFRDWFVMSGGVRSEPAPVNPRDRSSTHVGTPLIVLQSGDLFLTGDRHTALDQRGSQYGDNITTGAISGNTGLAFGRDAQAEVYIQPIDLKSSGLFSPVYQAITARRDEVAIEKAELTGTVRKIELEVAHGPAANAMNIKDCLKILANIAPDICQLTMILLTTQSLSLPTAIQQIIEESARMDKLQ